LTLLLLSASLLVASQISCVSAPTAPATVGFIEPPRAELEASLAREPIKASDVIRVKFPDGSQASYTQTYQVAPDGTIEVTGRGKVQVAGKTLKEAQEAVKTALAVESAVGQAVELAMSEYYLVQVDSNGVKRLTRVPIKGEPHVKDALANMKVDNKVMWIARPDPSRYLSEQVMPIDWESVSRNPKDRSNYLLQPGDWLFVAPEPATGFARVYNALGDMATAQKADLDRVR
jgi:protein involved in polysaccharide export with SLBB domain